MLGCVCSRFELFVEGLTKKPWYYAKMTREEAETFLNGTIVLLFRLATRVVDYLAWFSLILGLVLNDATTTSDVLFVMNLFREKRRLFCRSKKLTA